RCRAFGPSAGARLAVLRALAVTMSLGRRVRELSEEYPAASAAPARSEEAAGGFRREDIPKRGAAPD
ncbi:MAG TPA: hypothetical protein VM166_08250, partial [Gemmatimonadaceae bacterium]|nr:hypothetical protein [Gemmatimonadaceae bacterium]